LGTSSRNLTDWTEKKITTNLMCFGRDLHQAQLEIHAVALPFEANYTFRKGYMWITVTIHKFRHHTHTNTYIRKSDTFLH